MQGLVRMDKKQIDEWIKEWDSDLSPEEVLYHLYHNLPGGLSIKGVDGSYIFANKVVADYMGVPKPADLYGKTDEDFYNEEQAIRLREEENRVIRENKTFQGIVEPVENSSCVTRWWLSARSPIQENDSAPIESLLTLSLDITERKRMEEELRYFSEIDSLTGIYNRRLFDNILHKEWDRARRGRYPISLLMLDVDYFKKYNDTYGHPEGDLALRQVAQALKNQVKRPGDLACRYGGEEFALILPATDQKGALTVGKRIVQEIEDLAIPHAKSDVSNILTASWGVATQIPEHINSAEDLIKMADQALYAAKENGRNTYTIQPPSRY
jgi:diguanylate cyclase (GGDEF)-like protein